GLTQPGCGMKARALETRRKRERGAARRLGVSGDADAVVGSNPAARPERSWAEAERDRGGRPDVEPRGTLLRPAPGARAGSDFRLPGAHDRALEARLSVD